MLLSCSTFVICALVLQYNCHTCSCSAVKLSYMFLFCSTFVIPALVLQYNCYTCSCSAVKLSYMFLFCSTVVMHALVLQYICYTSSCSAVQLSHMLLFCSTVVIPALVLQYVSFRILQLSNNLHVKDTALFNCILFLLEFVFTFITDLSMYRLNNTVDNTSLSLIPTTNSKLSYSFSWILHRCWSFPVSYLPL
jgi:hypothetical protein